MYQVYSSIFRSLGLSDNIDILDSLLMTWIFFAFFVIIAVTVYQKYFGGSKFRRPRRARVDSDPGDGGLKQGNARPGVESAEWLTCLASWWLGSDTAWQPALITQWIKSVNEELKKSMGAECQLVIEGIKFNSEGQSLHFSNINTDTRNGNELILRMDLKLSDVTMEINIKSRNQSNQHSRDNHPDTLQVLISMQTSIKIYLSRLDAGLPGSRDLADSSCIRVSLSHGGQPSINRLKILSGGLTDNINTESLEKSLREGISHAGLMIEISQDGLTYKPGNDFNTPTIPTLANRVVTESGYNSLLLNNPNGERPFSYEYTHPIQNGLKDTDKEAQEWLEYKKLWTNGYTENKTSTASLAENKIQKEAGISNGIDKASTGHHHESTLQPQAGVRNSNHVTDDNSLFDDTSYKRTSMLSDQSEPINQSVDESMTLGSESTNFEITELNRHPPEYSIPSTDKEENDAEVKLNATQKVTEVSNVSTTNNANNETAESIEKKDQDLLNGESAPASKEETPQKKGFFSRTFSSKSKKRSSSAERPKSFTLVDINLDLDANKDGTLKVQPKLDKGGTLTPKSSEKVQPKQEKYGTLTPKLSEKEKGTKSNKKAGTPGVSEAKDGTLKVESKLDKSGTLTPKSGEKIKEKADTRKSRKSGMAEVEISSDGSTLRKARSNSLSSSFRNLFKRNRHKSGGGAGSVPPSRDEPLTLQAREILLDPENSQTNNGDPEKSQRNADAEKPQSNGNGENTQATKEESKIANGNDQSTIEIVQKGEMEIQNKLEGVSSEAADILNNNNNNNNTGLGLVVQSTMPQYQQGLPHAKQTVSSN